MGGRNFNDIMDYFSNQILLPVGGLLIAVFTGWVMTKQATRDELTSLNAVTYEIWHFLIRFVVPPALLVIFVMGVAG
jgi:NSS family neurotransmitter:Na+ symporter